MSGTVTETEIVNELADYSGLFQFIVERGIRSGPLIFYTDTLGVDTMNVCPGAFPLVGESQPEVGFVITSESGIISDTMIDFTQRGSAVVIICHDEMCEQYDSCMTSYSSNVSTRQTSRHPTTEGFQAVVVTVFAGCGSSPRESISRYTFERIDAADCSGQAAVPSGFRDHLMSRTAMHVGDTVDVTSVPPYHVGGSISHDH